MIRASKTVFASTGKGMVVACSTHRLCAERRLIIAWQRRALKSGVGRGSIVRWIRRKAGPTMRTWRRDANGREGVFDSVSSVSARDHKVGVPRHVLCESWRRLVGAFE